MRTYPLYVLVLRIYSFSQQLEFSRERAYFAYLNFALIFIRRSLIWRFFFFTIAQNAKLKTYEFRYQYGRYFYDVVLWKCQRVFDVELI